MLRKKIIFGGKNNEREEWIFGWEISFLFLMVPYVYLFIYLAMFIEHLLWPGLVSGMAGKRDSVPALRGFTAHGTDSR